MAASTSPDALSSLKLDALKQLASERGIKGYYRMRKDELVTALSSASAPTAATHHTTKSSGSSSTHRDTHSPASESHTTAPVETPVSRYSDADSTSDTTSRATESESTESTHRSQPRRTPEMTGSDRAPRRAARRESGPALQLDFNRRKPEATESENEAAPNAVEPNPERQERNESGYRRSTSYERKSSGHYDRERRYETPQRDYRAESRNEQASRDRDESDLDREERLARLADAVAIANKSAGELSPSEQQPRTEGGYRESRSYDPRRKRDDYRRTDYRRDEATREAAPTSENDERGGEYTSEHAEQTEGTRRYDRSSDHRTRTERTERTESSERTERSDRTDRYEDERRTRSRERSTRDRYASKQRRGLDTNGDAPEINEDDILVPVAGVLDVLDNHAFVRTSGYLPGPNDVYVSLNQVKRNGLRRGDAIVGAIKAPREGEQQTATRNKFSALVRVDSVNGLSVEDARQRPEFAKLTPLYPQERLRLETAGGANKLSSRMIDIIAPIGKGQRGLLVSPPKAGKTLMMQQIANSITTNNPEVHLMVVLVDERPEEVTDFQRSVQGEVIASTFDRHASDHTTVAELAIERAKRLVELGQDVVILLDGITRLSRAYNLAAPASGRILSGGVDAAALYPPKKFFGAARNIEGGGSLTILATALVETGSKMDEVIFEEFKGTGNMELRLSRSLAEKRIYPAINVNASSTRREEILLSKEELAIVYKLRRLLGALDEQQATELLLNKLKSTGTNLEFLMQVQKTTPGALADMVED